MWFCERDTADAPPAPPPPPFFPFWFVDMKGLGSSRWREYRHPVDADIPVCHPSWFLALCTEEKRLVVLAKRRKARQHLPLRKRRVTRVFVASLVK